MSFKNNIYKKVIAAATALTMVFAAAGCGESTSWIAKYNNKTVTAGIYIFYQTQAYNEVTTNLKKQNEELDISDIKLLKTMTYENKDLTSWINDNAQEQLRMYLAVNKKFDELGLSFTEEEQSEMDNMLEMYWQYYSQNYEQNGIGKESFKELIELDSKKEKVFDYYYGEGGEKECSDAEIGAYLEGNYSRVKTIALHLTDGKDEDLDDAGKKKIKEMAEDYKKRAAAGENFDDLIKEYNDYRDKLVKEANPEEGEETAEEPAVTTTAPVVTTVAEAVTTAETSESDEEAVTTAEASESDEEEVTTAEDSESDEETVTTAEDSEENEEAVTTAPEKSEETAVTTEAEESESEEEADPYANEKIYKKGSEDDGYQPSQTVNDAIFNNAMVGGDPYIVEDTENKYIYVIQRLDILQRKDFFEDDKKSNILWEMFEEDFNKFTKEWITLEDINFNNSAVRRYDPFNIKF